MGLTHTRLTPCRRERVAGYKLKVGRSSNKVLVGGLGLDPDRLTRACTRNVRQGVKDTFSVVVAWAAG